MSGPPFSPGFLQLAVRLVDEPETAASVGLSGVADFSWTSARVTLTPMVSVPPFPSTTFTVML